MSTRQRFNRILFSQLFFFFFFRTPGSLFFSPLNVRIHFPFTHTHAHTNSDGTKSGRIFNLYYIYIYISEHCVFWKTILQPRPTYSRCTLTTCSVGFTSTLRRRALHNSICRSYTHVHIYLHLKRLQLFIFPLAVFRRSRGMHD